MSEDSVFGVSCPHPSCEGVIRIRPNVPAGDYECKCKACTVRLGWATFLQGGRKPYLSLAEQEGGRK